MSILPASILDRSRMSLISASRCLAARSTRSSGSSSSSRFRSTASSCSISVTPMIALSGVRNSCDMLARNCDFSWLATSSCWLFSLISWNRRAFWMASTDWPAKVCSSVTTDGENSPATLRRITSAPITWSSRKQRHRQHRAHALAQQRIAHPAVFPLLHVRNLVGAPVHGALAHGGFPEADPRFAQYADIGVAHAVAGPRLEHFGGLVELVDRAARVGLRQLDGVGDDGHQHGLEVQGRADRPADFAEGVHFLDRARERLGARSSSRNTRTFSMAITA